MTHQFSLKKGALPDISVAPQIQFSHCPSLHTYNTNFLYENYSVYNTGTLFFSGVKQAIGHVLIVCVEYYSW